MNLPARKIAVSALLLIGALSAQQKRIYTRPTITPTICGQPMRKPTGRHTSKCPTTIWTYLRILASDIPATGYKVFEIRDGAGRQFSPAAEANANTGIIENSCTS